MKYSKIALACGLALSAMAAQAAGPTIPAGTVVIYVTGASAPDNFINDTMKDMLENEIAIKGLQNGSSSGESQFRAFLGKARQINVTGTAGSYGVGSIAAGTDVLLIKRSKGGSVWGVNPLARADRIETLDFNACTALTPNLTINPATGLATQPYSWECATKGADPSADGTLASNATDGQVPDFGISDVEPAMFKGPYNTENGFPQLTSTQLNRLTSTPLNQLMMGIVATDAVSETTHISRSQYGAMLAGKMRTWKEIDGSNSPVVVCRRVDGSGTQTSYNWFFTGFPCTAALNAHSRTVPADATFSTGYDGEHEGTTGDPVLIDVTAGYTVIENSSSTNVRDCLKAAQNRTVFNVRGANNVNYRVNFNALPVGSPAKAIGVLSLDSYTNATFDPTIVNSPSANGFTFRMLDGAGRFNGVSQLTSAGATGMAPSKANLINGKYDFTVELTAQRRNASVTNPTGDVVAPFANNSAKAVFYTQLVRNLGSIKYTGNVGGNFTNTPNAFATIPSSTVSYTVAANAPYVNRFSRGGNTCSPLIGF